MKQNIVCYMPISNNKQPKYREGKTAWECGILPRDNLCTCSSDFEIGILENTQIENTHILQRDISEVKLRHTGPADFAPLYTYKS